MVTNKHVLSIVLITITAITLYTFVGRSEYKIGDTFCAGEEDSELKMQLEVVDKLNDGVHIRIRPAMGMSDSIESNVAYNSVAGPYIESGVVSKDKLTTIINANSYKRGACLLSKSKKNELDAGAVRQNKKLNEFISEIRSLRDVLSANPDAISKVDKKMLIGIAIEIDNVLGYREFTRDEKNLLYKMKKTFVQGQADLIVQQSSEFLNLFKLNREPGSK